MDAININQAAPDIMDAHINYLNRVCDYLAGKIPDPLATQHTKCMLGKWYFEAAPQIPAFANHPMFPELGRLHQDFHAACEEAVQGHNSGNAALAQAALQSARDLSSEICEALIELLGL
jgi:hypothetical protein